MSTDVETSADLKAIFAAVAQKKPVDPDVAKRVREKSEAVRRKFQEELSVKLLRSVREE
jgi:hypothetical protein